VINLEFTMPDGSNQMLYDVHPLSQEQDGLDIPEGAVRVTVWIGTRE